jgi:hypothetical protein
VGNRITSRIEDAPASNITQPARRREPVLERADVVVVDALGGRRVPAPRRRVGLEARALVERVVELAVGVGQLAPADHGLEALGELGVVAVRARERRDLARVVVHERRLDQRALARRLVDLRHQPTRSPARLVRHAEPVADRPRPRDRHRGVHAHAAALLDQLRHRDPPPRRRQVDRATVDLDHGGPERRLCRVHDQRLDQLHDVAVIPERLVGLQQRELGVVARVEALVAEHAPDLEDALQPADHAPLERQLERDAQAHVEVKRVVVGGERAGGGAPRARVEHGGLDLDEPALGERAAHGGDRARADLEDPPRARVDDQVEVALAQARVGVAEAAVLVGQRPQRLGQQGERLHAHGQLAAARDDHRARDADPVAAVQRGEVGLQRVADVGVRDQQLDLGRPVVQVGEHQPAVAAQRHHPSGDAHAFAGLGSGGQVAAALAQLPERAVGVVARGVRLDAPGAQRVELGEPLRALGGDEVLGGRVSAAGAQVPGAPYRARSARGSRRCGAG